MKKLVIALAIMAMAAIAQADIQFFSGWNCKDVTLLQQQLNWRRPKAGKINTAVVLAVAQNQPADFAACAVIDNAITAIKPDATDAEKLWVRNSMQIAPINGLLMHGNIVKAKPSDYDKHYLLGRTLHNLGKHRQLLRSE